MKAQKEGDEYDNETVGSDSDSPEEISIDFDEDEEDDEDDDGSTPEEPEEIEEYYTDDDEFIDPPVNIDDFFADDDGTVVSGIAIAQLARRQIKHTDEESDKHVGVVVLTGVLVQDLHDAVGTALMSRH